MEGFVEGSRRPRHQNHRQRERRLSQLKALRDDIEGVASRFADCSSSKHGENAGLTKVRTVQWTILLALGVAEVLEPSQNHSYSVCLAVEEHTISAELRASVFKAIEEKDRVIEKEHGVNHWMTSDGSTCVGLPLAPDFLT